MVQKSTRSRKTGRTSARPILQWIMAVVGGLVTAAVIGVIIWEALQPARAPALEASIVAVTRTSSGYVAEVEVVNQGTETAAAVEVSGTISTDVASATIDYVPGGGTGAAFLQFRTDPRHVVVEVTGWSSP